MVIALQFAIVGIADQVLVEKVFEEGKVGSSMSQTMAETMVEANMVHSLSPRIQWVRGVKLCFAEATTV